MNSILVKTQFCKSCQRRLGQDDFYPSTRGIKGSACKKCRSEYMTRKRKEQMTAPVNRRSHSKARSIAYDSVHHRIRYQRGSASLYPCITRCGSQARDYAWTHQGESALGYPNGKNGKAAFYGIDINTYVPMCRSCHTKFDRGLISLDFA